LFFVPVVYSYLRRQPPKNYESELQQEDAATQSSDRESL
jgi:hypothetical protein